MYLNCKTYFSLKYGTFSTEALVNEAVQMRITSLALTNINATTDVWDFVRLCRSNGIKPIAGAEIRNGDRLLYLLIAANTKGLTAIHHFLSDHLLSHRLFPDQPELPGDTDDVYVIFPLNGKASDTLLPNEYIGVTPAELPQLYNINFSKRGDRYVIRQPVTFRDKTGFNVHRLLRAVANNTLLSKLATDQHAPADECFHEPETLLHAFRQYPFMIGNTYRLMDACGIEFDFNADKTKTCFTGSVEDDRALLVKLARNGLRTRYPKGNRAAKERLEKELGIIDRLGFNAYFLVNHDIIRYAQSQGYYYVGRGSGANSIVAYCLRITDVDPIELNLYFERFLNPERTSSPDFDIDFSYTDRDEIMDYIFKRYGSKHVALLGSYTTFKTDSIIRELGKVFGLPDDEIKQLQRYQRPTDHIQELILRFGKLIRGFPNNLSVHACGMLISETAIRDYATLYMPPKGMPTAQMDMFTAEDIGLNKFDILSQRGLGHIRECMRLVRENRGIDVNIHDFDSFRNDERIKLNIRTANTIGCFYIESPAMRQLLLKLGCDDYPTLVAASSIIRPGVAQSGMMRAYISRYHDHSTIPYLHPLFEEHLSETFGVMVFQEDVIKIAHYFAGLSLGEADVLRRAMSGKYRSHDQFRIIRDKFYEGCRVKGHTPELAAEVWRQMESFAGYSFNKAHSASFAVESYMSLYLKTYFPVEFMVAVINNFGGYYSRELYFIELLKSGGDIEAPCVNRSDEYTNITDKTVYCGLIHVGKLQEQLRGELLNNRRTYGEYVDLADFIDRVKPGLEQLNILIQIGALRFTGKSKKQLFWEANFLHKRSKETIPAAASLFIEPPVSFALPPLADDAVDDLYDQLEVLGYTLSNPFALADADPTLFVASRDLHRHLHNRVTVLGYFIARKHARTKNDDDMFFGTFVDASLDWIDTVHFPKIAEKFPLHTGGFYRIGGKVVEDFGVYSIEVHTLEAVGYKSRSYDHV